MWSKRRNLNLRNYLHERYQRVFFNLQTSSWELISGVQQGSVLGPLMFLIHINNLPYNIQSTFADDTSLFSHVSDKSTSQSELIDNKQLGLSMENAI